MKKWFVGAASAALLMFATTAAANGPCGQDFDGNHACGVSSPFQATGSLITDNEKDYYVLHAHRGTELSLGITDTEDPGCSTSDSIGCGRVSVELYDGRGNDIGGPGWSEPNNGITVPQTWAHTLDTTGNYYLIVSGRLGDDANDNPTAVPYTLDVTASPNVVWPPPPPQHITKCTTKRVWRRWRHGHHHRRHRVTVRRCRTYTIYP